MAQPPLAKFPGFKVIEKYYKLNVYDKEDLKFFVDNNALSSEQYRQLTITKSNPEGDTYPEETEETEEITNDEKA